MNVSIGTLALLAAFAPGAPRAGPASTPVPLVTETRPALGSLATVSVAGADPGAAADAIETAFGVFERVGWSMNEWRADSPLSALNTAAGGDWVPLPADLCDALARAGEGAVRTGGRFDPTWAALSDLWRFDGPPGAPGTPPADADVLARCPLVDHRGLSIRPLPGGACEGRLARRGMRVGLGGLAKGWALDAAATAVRALGIRDFLLQAGGDLYGAGRPAGAPWPVAVRDPRGGPLDVLATVPVSDRAFSTSGDYEHAYVAGRRRYHHVIDPRTCRPATASRSVSVLAPSAVEAEILDKALFVAGGEQALALARENGAEAIVVDSAGHVLATAGLRAFLPGR
ncbi:MAG TPA: FAD:protein FMN transferase [Anaeromyxobacteraceae bacterium]|nr:FAD:protein FMN transferase [Anaeromyxobacteraceae bacterium]